MPCTNCHRDESTVIQTTHHLIPVVKGGKNKETIPLCQDCHNFLNTQFTESQQRDLLFTKELLVTNEKMAAFAKFARKQNKKVKQRESNERYRWR